MTTLEDLPLGEVLGARLGLSSLGSLAATSRALRDRLSASDGLWVDRLSAQFGNSGSTSRDAAAHSGSGSGGGATTAAPPPAAGAGRAALRAALQAAARLCTDRPAREAHARAYNSPPPGVARIALARPAAAEPPGPTWAPPRLAVAVDGQLWFSAPGRRRRFSGAGGHSAWADCLIEVAPGR